jgi:hypothetical protein
MNTQTARNHVLGGGLCSSSSSVSDESENDLLVADECLKQNEIVSVDFTFLTRKSKNDE